MGSPISTATATGSAPASATMALRRSPTMSSWMALFRAIQRGDTKPLAKALLKRFGTLSEVLAA